MATRPQTPSERSMFLLSAMSTARLLLGFVGSILAVQTNGLSGSPGPLADSCGVSAQPGAQGQGARGTPVFPPGQYPVKLPAVSLLGARNDLPNPFRAGVHWGQLPDGRKWGSTAGVSAAPDGKTIWAIDRCGASGAGGTACADSPFDPVLQFDPAGKLLKSLGRGMIVSPHKITVDRDGNVWVADNGSARRKGQQVLKFSPDHTPAGRAWPKASQRTRKATSMVPTSSELSGSSSRDDSAATGTHPKYHPRVAKFRSRTLVSGLQQARYDKLMH